MKLQRKEWLLFTAPLMVGGVAWIGLSWSNRCPEHCEFQAGNFNSEAAGVKAAFQLLSQQMTRCSKSTLYTSRFNVVVKGTVVDEVKIQFEPSTNILAFVPDNSAQISLWRQVSKRAIHEVALYPSNLNGLKKYGSYRTR